VTVPTHLGSFVMNGLAQQNVSSLRIFYDGVNPPPATMDN
jgi:hypothetical protein